MMDANQPPAIIDTIPLPKPDPRKQLGHSGTASLAVLLPRFPQSVSFSCGPGTVSISLDTGKVTLKNCPADAGAKAFWDAVEIMFPGRDLRPDDPISNHK